MDICDIPLLQTRMVEGAVADVLTFVCGADGSCAAPAPPALRAQFARAAGYQSTVLGFVSILRACGDDRETWRPVRICSPTRHLPSARRDPATRCAVLRLWLRSVIWRAEIRHLASGDPSSGERRSVIWRAEISHRCRRCSAEQAPRAPRPLLRRLRRCPSPQWRRRPQD